MATEWKPLAPGSMPAVDNLRQFLLCKGIHNPDDQIMCLGAHVWYGVGDPYIRYVCGQNGWEYLPEEDYKDFAWTEIPYPDGEV